MTVALLQSDPAAIAFGYGAGSMSVSDMTGARGELVERHGAILVNAVSAVRAPLEFGVVGVLCLAGVLVAIHRAGRNVKRRSKDSFWRAAAMGLQGIVVAMVLLSLYANTFAADALACTLWAMAGLVMAEVPREANSL